ncbi:type II toxin-antitoxin system HicB family antitoxin [Peptoniphilus sp. EMRHCC_23]|uniref:type II toxin-antitoxin system HicB family antitoxin n=1 Tax=Peptoniphilus rachelemmaiella TaxID=2811779 RepID=UPI001BFFE364|nr:type II toxin-antitoxin system HicB family antitoxin [Peptoniphilus rachelemmaiella]
MKDRYIFPAIISFSEDEGIYDIIFPDISNGFTFAESEDEIMESAKEVLELCLYDLEENGNEIPSPTSFSSLLNKGLSVVLVEVWMPLVRDKFQNKSVKKTLTIPKWLNDAAQEYNINFSQLLQTAIKNYIGIDTKR